VDTLAEALFLEAAMEVRNRVGTECGKELPISHEIKILEAGMDFFHLVLVTLNPT
jgi:hypothetical protein